MCTFPILLLFCSFFTYHLSIISIASPLIAFSLSLCVYVSFITFIFSVVYLLDSLLHILSSFIFLSHHFLHLIIYFHYLFTDSLTCHSSPYSTFQCQGLFAILLLVRMSVFFTFINFLFIALSFTSLILFSFFLTFSYITRFPHVFIYNFLFCHLIYHHLVPSPQVSRSKLRLLSLSLNGSGSITNVTLASAEHLHHFYDAADWLLRHQDQQGGWSIPVPRKVSCRQCLGSCKGAIFRYLALYKSYTER